MPDNREWALLIWLGVLLLWVLSRKDLRASLGQVFRTAANPKILIPLAGMIGYILLELWIGERLSLWHGDLTADTVVWVIVTAVVLFLNFDEASKPHFFRRRSLETLGVTEFVQFFTNLFVLSLVAEIALQPFLALLGGMGAIANTDSRYKDVKKLVNGLLVLIGLALLAFSVEHLVAASATIDWYAVLRKFALPVWLTIGLLPYIYLLSLYANYDRAFTFIDMAMEDRGARRRAKLALVLRLNFRSRDSQAFANPWLGRIAAASSLAAARKVVADFQQSLRDAERAPGEPQGPSQILNTGPENSIET